LLPNYAFLHFPVVDYRTLRRGYFACDIHSTQRAGLKMMLRGTIHLLLYRLIYHRLLVSPEDVHDLASLASFLACNYLLYLRVSGQFHMACGILHLFGYQLPETHHHYLLATSFTDYWRRINIYWKDFMVRVVFHPLMFRWKKWPQPRALALATASVFVVTWALHAYQSFWLRGRWGFSLTDALFWGILGLLVIVNVQRDAQTSRARRERLAAGGTRAVALRAFKTVGTFVTICLLWSLWSSPSLAQWLSMLRRALP
jgi:D-alanyl-lipoteichoic acid acyltransferase DltB (MBOAT superfamily)